MNDFPNIKPNEVLGGTQLIFLEKLGGGAEAQVWKVCPYHSKNDVFAARVSFIRSDTRSTKEYVTWRKQLEAETENWRAFQHSLFVVSLRNSDEYQNVEIEGEDWDLFLQYMDWIRDGSLADKMFGEPRTEFLNSVGDGADLIRFMSQIASSVRSGHEAGLAHGDLKPSNIMLHLEPGKNGFPQLMDFGISSKVQESFKSLRGFVGTPEYAAPELLRKEANKDVKTDIYSLGVVFCELLMGKRFIDGADINDSKEARIAATLAQLDRMSQIKSSEFAADTNLKSNQANRLQSLLRKMTHKDPGKRSPSLESCITSLSDIASPQRRGSIATRHDNLVYPDAYRWPKWLHKLVGERPYYFVVKSVNSIDDEAWLKKTLADEGVTGYSMYRLVGSYDFMVRTWVTDETQHRVDDVIEQYKDKNRYDCEIEVISIKDYDIARDGKSSMNGYESLSEVLSEIAASADENLDTEFRNLLDKGLVTSQLGDDRKPPTAIRVFMFVIFPRDSLDPLLWETVQSALREILEPHESGKSPLIRNVSSYQCQIKHLTGLKGGTQAGVMFRFILKNYHQYSKIIEAIGAEKARIEAHVRDTLRVTSLFELDLIGRVESDDGNIVALAEDYRVT